MRIAYLVRVAVALILGTGALAACGDKPTAPLPPEAQYRAALTAFNSKLDELGRAHMQDLNIQYEQEAEKSARPTATPTPSRTTAKPSTKPTRSASPSPDRRQGKTTPTPSAKATPEKLWVATFSLPGVQCGFEMEMLATDPTAAAEFDEYTTHRNSGGVEVEGEMRTEFTLETMRDYVLEEAPEECRDPNITVLPSLTP